MTQEFAGMTAEFEARNQSLAFVINKEYGDRMQALVDAARTNSRATSDPAFRLLQILTRVRTKAGKLAL